MSSRAAELDDIPDDQEIAGEIELFDQRQFALDLCLGALPQRSSAGMIAIARAFVGALAQERIHGFARRNGIARELIAEIGERELQTIRELRGVGDGFRDIGEEARHFVRRFSDAARS